MIDERTGEFFLGGLPRAREQFQRGGFAPLAGDEEEAKVVEDKDENEEKS